LSAAARSAVRRAIEQTLRNDISVVTSDITELIIASLLVPLVLTPLKRPAQLIHPHSHPLENTAFGIARHLALATLLISI
jgi:hypothetical protein